jgi:hypothetical protein
MRNLLALVGAAVLTFAGVGWYLGWYSFHPTPSATPGHQGVNIDIDAQKIKSDVHKGEVKVEQAIDHLAKEATSKGTQGVAPPIKGTAQ